MFLVGVCGALAAQEAPSLTAQLSRHFDFEEDVDRDGLPDADLWRIIQGRNDPLDPKARLVATSPHSGRLCLAVNPDGTRTAFQTAEAVPLDPRFTYRVTAWLRLADIPTEGLRRTVVRIETVLMDPTEKPLRVIPGPDFTGSHQEWQPVVIDIPRAADGRPRKLRVNLVIDGSALSGTCWFDDIRLQPQPTIDLRTSRPGNVLEPGDNPTLTVELATLTDPSYELVVTRQSVAEAPAQQPDAVLYRGRLVPDLKREGHVELKLPLTRFEVFGLRAVLWADGSERARRLSSIAYCPPVPHGEDWAGQFGTATLASIRGIEDLGPALARAGAGRLLVVVWSPSQTEESLAETRRRLDPMLTLVRQAGVEPVMVLAGSPRVLARKLVEDHKAGDEAAVRLVQLLAADRKYWLPLLKVTTDSFAHRARYWQVGDEPDALLTRGELESTLKTLSVQLNELTYRHSVGVAVGALTDPAVAQAASASADFITVDAGAALPPEAIPALLAGLGPPKAERWVKIDLLDRRRFDRTTVLADMIERAVWARVGGASSVIVGPVAGGLFDEELHPLEPLAALASLARNLDGLDYVGDLSTSADARAMTFSNGRRTTVVVWSHEEHAVWSHYLGPAAKAVDLCGNNLPLSPVGGTPVLAVPQLPFFVTDADTGALMTELGARVSPGALESTTEPQQIELTLTNHFTSDAAGKVTVEAPAGWEIEPREIALQLVPGGKLVHKLTVKVPPGENVGAKLLRLKIDLRAGGNFTLPCDRPLELVSRTFQVQAKLERPPGRPAIVKLVVTNQGAVESRVSCFAMVVGKGRQESFINGLAPGQSAERLFQFDALGPEPIWVGVRELTGRHFYNELLQSGTTGNGYDEILP